MRARVGRGEPGRWPVKKAEKEPYEPPRIRKVKLVAGEVAVVHCKSVQLATNVCRRGAVVTNKTIGS
jgi:Zn finger protein HypA/HybF involved in hydrogenase expression